MTRATISPAYSQFPMFQVDSEWLSQMWCLGFWGAYPMNIAPLDTFAPRYPEAKAATDREAASCNTNIAINKAQHTLR